MRPAERWYRGESFDSEGTLQQPAEAPGCDRKATDVSDPPLSPGTTGVPAPHRASVVRPRDLDTDRLVDDLSRAGSSESLALIDAALRLVTSFASFTVRGADGVSITLDRRGQMMTVAGSDDTVRSMDEHQYATGEGPCLAAAAGGHWVHSPSLADERRWPVFVPRALEEGIASVMSTPLLVSAAPVGAINMYSRSSAVFGDGERKVSVFFAKRAAEILAASAEVDEQQRVRISEALTTREIIAMAQGVHMTRLGLSSDEAAAELYRSARTKEITVRAEALAVLGSTGRTGGGTDDRHGR